MRRIIPDLFLDYQATTGISFIDSDKTVQIRDVQQLPDFKIEIHQFWSTDSACLFEAGLATAGGGNHIVWDHDRAGSYGHLILVAHLQEPRPSGASLADAIQIVEHKHAGVDGKRIAAFTTALVAERQQAEDARRAIEAPVIAELQRLGIRATHGGWASVGLRLPAADPHQHYIRAFLNQTTWQLSISLTDNNNYLSEQPLDDRLSCHFLATGWHAHKDAGTWRTECETLEQVAEATRRMHAAESASDGILLALWRERNEAAAAAKRQSKKIQSAARRKRLS